MTRYLLNVLLSAVVLATAAAPAHAAEPYFKFVQGLRERRYYDYAMQYLDDLEKRPEVPDEVRQAIPFEKATTLQQSARSIRSPEVKTEQLSQAEALLEQFVKANPLHPKAGQANSQRARILLGRAQVAIWQSRSPANSSKKVEYRSKARQYVKKARSIFQQAHDQHKASWKTFPTYVDERDDPKLYRERGQAEVAYMRAQLDLAQSTYEEAQTYESQADQFTKLLNQAAAEFNEIHTKYRSLVAGLYARMWQGKCYEEQDDLRKALGVYNELLRHGKPLPGEPPKPVNPSMKRMQDQVLQFRLICLNNEKRHDYHVVVLDATDWLKINTRGNRPRTERGLAIMWERARAHETLGMQRTLPETDRKKFLDSAIADARYISRWPGQYKDVSTFMVQRVSVAVGRDPQDPKDFDTAFGLGRSLIKQVKGFDDQIADPKNKDKVNELRQARDNHMLETTRIFKIALDLADKKTEPKQVNHARYLLAYVYYLTRRSSEAAVLGEFVGRHFDKESSSMGLDAAFLAMAAYVQMYNQVPKGDSKEFELTGMARAANLITDVWPESERANDARMTLGRTFGQLKQPVEGAKWYGQVPTSAPQYTSAQIRAGQSYWTAYLEAAILPSSDPKKPAIEELQKWQDASQKHLEVGIAQAKAKLPKDATSGEIFDEYIAAKVSLAQIRVNTGDYSATIELLNGDPHSVIKAIVVPKDAKRPKVGIKSQKFAVLSYQLLLRGYVGTQKIKSALGAMAELEKLAPDAESVMAIYVQLGRELEKEIERLTTLEQTDRLAEVRTSFEKFLSELYGRRKTMPAGSLIWIAETYYGLANGLGDDQAAASGYFNKAADTYQTIISGAESKGRKWLDPARVVGVKLRLVNCRRKQGDFETAMDLITDVLDKKPKALDAQFEAAFVLQDWADSGQGDNWKRFEEAIQGTQVGQNKQVKVWGWGYTAILLQRRIDAGIGNDEQQRRMYEARYNSIWCRYRFALAQSSTPKRTQSLGEAKQETDVFVGISIDVPVEWQGKFNALYRELLQTMIDEGMSTSDQPLVVADIDWPKDVPKPKVTAKTDDGGQKQIEKGTITKETVTEESSGGMLLPIIVGLILLGGAGFLMFQMWRQDPSSRPVAVYAEAAPILPPQGARSAKKRRAAAERSQAVRQTGKKNPASQQQRTSAKPSEPRQKPRQKPS